MKMTKAVTEKAAAPRVTKEQIEVLLSRVEVHTTTCQEPTPHVMAIAWLNGKFHLGTAISKAVNPENFNEEMGIEYSTKDVLGIAENKLWELEGYRLFASNSQPKNHIERMKLEKHELDLKLNGLKKFLSGLGGENTPLLTDNQVHHLELQSEAMEQYSNILGARIEYDSDLFKAVGSLEA